MNFASTLDTLQDYADDCISLMQEKLQHTDNLKNSLTYKITPDKNGWILSFEFPDYAIFVNDGRKPNSKQPPIEPIKKWAIQKGLPDWKDDRGKFISENSRAFLIARAIGRRGIKPIPFMDIPLNKSAQLADEIGGSFSKDLALTLQTVFNKAGIGDSA